MMEIGYKEFPTELSVDLPISKSIVARQLVLDYIHNTPLADRINRLEGYFLPLDIKYIANALLRLEKRKRAGNREPILLETGQSGTAYRFLLVLALWEKGDVTLSHEPQLTKRIKAIDLLPFIEIGAKIDFRPDQNKTYIKGNRKVTGDVDDSKWNTSQFSSALLLTEPLHRGSIRLQKDLNRSSYSYYELTQKVIKEYRTTTSTSEEGDWSAAAFWYQLMVSHPEIHAIHFNNLNSESAQPDRVITRIFQNFGINTDANNKLTRIPKVSNKLHIDLSQSLDLFPSIMISAIWLNIPFEISGIKNLRVKESDRISSIIENFKALGVDDINVKDDIIYRINLQNVPRVTFKDNAILNSYDDHRIAMSFGVLATSIKNKNYKLIGAEAVSKSYPNFFESLLKKQQG